MREDPVSPKGEKTEEGAGEGEGEGEGEEEEKAKREKMGRMRHNAAMEILTSEETYLTSLMLVREMFLKPFEEVWWGEGGKGEGGIGWRWFCFFLVIVIVIGILTNLSNNND